ncbi:MAG: imidazole glycerol phosphate synthase subunit HisH [Anaerolineales bacterium]|nr:imidazole glycerol phosphate synthase subunit HisH [Anaerolineales bacterium]
MIALVDYGIGNLRSVANALRYVGAEVEVTSDPAVLSNAEKIVLPGVGAFGDGMAFLAEYGLVQPLKELVSNGKFLLGICLGMQLLFEKGEEHGATAGLGLLPGRVRAFPPGDLKIPQIGWNEILPNGESTLLSGLPQPAYAYFNHGYYCDALPEDTAASCEYGVRFCAVAERNNLMGVQFHPEKSQQAGLQLLQNFVRL